MSRRHGMLVCRNGRWWVRTIGRRPVRLPSGELHPDGEPVPLAAGYTPLFVAGSQGREHLLELYVVGPDGDRPRARPDHETIQPSVWPLDPEDLLALVVLGQRYLRHEPRPQPLSWHQSADQLRELDPRRGWTAKRVERRVAKVRHRLSVQGVVGLVVGEVTPPIGNQLNDNLLRELVRSATLVPTDLARLDG